MAVKLLGNALIRGNGVLRFRILNYADINAYMGSIAWMQVTRLVQEDPPS
jgi:hypothetical protein